uniref:Uncharacterized protein n=1 Tax=Gossypium raimondii TaxID=29730 RepID=A0A0D2TPW5_GOSRA|nr:hypothetical protein B456_009G141100 [Gossypium raimondii]
MQHLDKKAVENGHPISVFLNSITEIENGLWRSPTPRIRICHFQSFERRIFHPKQISFSSHTLNSHYMHCSIPFSRNELESTTLELPCQVLRVPSKWSRLRVILI